MKEVERFLKNVLKRKQKYTKALLITFLMTGGLAVATYTLGARTRQSTATVAPRRTRHASRSQRETRTLCLPAARAYPPRHRTRQPR